MTIGTLFTLFVTPAVYTYVARDARRHGRPRARHLMGRRRRIPQNEAIAGGACCDLRPLSASRHRIKRRLRATDEVSGPP